MRSELEYDLASSRVTRLVVCVGLLLFPTIVAAQGPAPSLVASVASPPHAPELARYARYSPLVCAAVPVRRGSVAAAERRINWSERWIETAAIRHADSVYYAAADQATATEVRNCLTPFTVANTPPNQLWSLGEAWLSIGDEAKAAEAFAQFLRMHTQAPVTHRAWWLAQLVQMYANAKKPAQLRTAFAYLAQLDSLGAPALGFRLGARNSLIRVATEMDSLPFMIERARDARALSQTLTGELQREWFGSIAGAVLAQVAVEQRQKRYQQAIDTLDAASKEFQQFNFGPSVTQLRFQLTQLRNGIPMPATKASYLYSLGQSAPVVATTRPVTKGKVTLFIRVKSTRLIGSLDFDIYRFAQRVIEQYGARVDVVALATTRGFDRFELASDSVEAVSWQEFAHGYMHLTMPLAVFVPKVTGKQADGRLIREWDTNSFGDFTLVDKQGLVRDWANNLQSARWMHMIDEMLREPDPQ